MASSSSHQQNQELNAFSGIEPAGKRRNVCESSRVHDVFINHRGPDVKLTLATQLYNSLDQLGIRAFLDSEEKELGISFPSTIETAIRSAKVHIAIFSPRYAESPWCLAELLLMLQSTAKIIPVFYKVKPTDLRHIEKGAYAEAFIKYQEKGRYLEKLEAWKEALGSLSLVAGEEFNSESECQTIVAAIQKEVQRQTCLHVAEYPIGLNNLVRDFEKLCLDELVQDFENQCWKEEGKPKAQVVGIFGMGGAGKTTLAKELFNRKKSNYTTASFLFDVREKSVTSQLPSLQQKLIKDLFDGDLSFISTEEGTSSVKDHLSRHPTLSALIVVDDVDHVEQLNALRVMDFSNKSGNSLVIVTTRDVGVLIAGGITVGYNVRGMSTNYGRELFCWHAFGQAHPCSGYEVLVDSFVNVCAGLPLSLLVLGRHVRGRDQRFWESELIKAGKTLPQDVRYRLKISFDALNGEEKQVFMDIACFFVGKLTSIAKRVLEGSGWNVHNAMEGLKDKCLLEKEVYNNWKGGLLLRMHDHLRDLGREMALELSPPHRLWRPRDLKSLEKMGIRTILAKTNIKCFDSFADESMGCRVTLLLGHPDTLFETSASLLWLQIDGVSKEPSIPAWIPLQKLRFLKINCGGLKTLWEHHTQAPSQLKELQIHQCSALEELRIELLSSLETLSITECGHLKTVSGISYLAASLVELEISKCSKLVFENLTLSDMKRLRSIIIDGGGNLKYFRLDSCPKLKKIGLHRSWLDELKLERLSSLETISITFCENLKTVSGISNLACLVELEISNCSVLVFENLSLSDMECLERITFDRGVNLKCFTLDSCPKLNTIRLHRTWLLELRLERLSSLETLSITDCGHLEGVSGISNLASLVELEISKCSKLVFESLTLNGMKRLEALTFDRGVDIKYFRLDGCSTLKTVRGINYDRLVELRIRDCPVLEELPTSIGPSFIERIIIDGCGKLKYFENLKNVAGKCPELEGSPNSAILSGLDHLKILWCEKLHNITLSTTVISLFVQSCRALKRISGIGNLMKLTKLIIRDCPELEALPILSRVNCLEHLKIRSCEKLKNIILPTSVLLSLSIQSCRCLQRVAGIGDFPKLTKLIIEDCPELEELPILERLSCLEKIKIDSSEKLQNSAGIEELQESTFAQLSYCSNALIQSFIDRLKSHLSRGVYMIGRAVDGAESSLNESLFCGVDEVIEIDTYKTYLGWLKLSAVIGCFVVEIDSSTSVADINRSLQHFANDNSIQVREGEWIIILSGIPYLMYSYLQEIQGVLKRYRVMKKGFRVDVKKGEEEKIMGLVRNIVDRVAFYRIGSVKYF